MTVSRRLPARELLQDPFLQIDDHSYNSRMIECQTDIVETRPLFRQPFFEPYHDTVSLINGYSNNQYYEIENGWDCDPMGMEPHGIDIFTSQEDEPFTNVGITIKGKRRDDGGIFLRLRIADKEGQSLIFSFSTSITMIVFCGFLIFFFLMSNYLIKVNTWISFILQVAFATSASLLTLKLILH